MHRNFRSENLNTSKMSRIIVSTCKINPFRSQIFIFIQIWNVVLINSRIIYFSEFAIQWANESRRPWHGWITNKYEKERGMWHYENNVTIFSIICHTFVISPFSPLVGCQLLAILSSWHSIWFIIHKLIQHSVMSRFYDSFRVWLIN